MSHVEVCEAPERATLMTYSLLPVAPYRRAIAIDVGKTRTTVGVVTSSGVVEQRFWLETQAGSGVEGIFDRCIGAAQSLLSCLSSPADAVGIGVPAIVVPARGVIQSSGAFPFWNGLDLQELFEHSLGLPTVVDNDVAAAAIGEARLGAGRGCASVVYLSIGTGVAFATTNKGDLCRGAHGIAGQIAWLPLPASHKTVDEALGGWGIALAMSGVEEAARTAQAVFDLAREGDAAAMVLVDEAIEAAASTLAWIQQIVDPEVFVIGGGIGLGQIITSPRFRNRVNQILARYRPHIPNGLRLLPAALGADAGIIGAALLALDV